MGSLDVHSPLEKVFRLTAGQKQALKKLGLLTVRDLLYHFPARYGEVAESKPIAMLQAGETVFISGKLSKLEKTRAWKKKTPMTKAVLEDATGKISVVWFHQPYIAKMLHEGSLIGLKGKVQKNAHGLYLANPDTERNYNDNHNDNPAKESDDSRGAGNNNNGVLPYPGYQDKTFVNQDYDRLMPVYPESRGITSRWFYYALKKIFAERAHEELPDPIPASILKKYNLPSLQTALIWIHEPKKKANADVARKRFAFEEVFFIQLVRLRERLAYQAHETFSINPPPESVRDFTKRFSFELTGAQKRAIDTITRDFKKEKPMSRLLEGDVGSGKTAVAATTAYAVATSRPNGKNFGNLQVAYMAPTEILAKQHFESFIELFNHLPIQIGLITSSGCKKFPSKIYADYTRTTRGLHAEKIVPWTDISRAQLLKWVANGEIPILIGTHALIQKTVQFKHLAYVVIDEQHRFGVQQRARLVARGRYAEHTQKNAEDTFLYKDLTYRIRAALFNVKKNLGSGHKESVYHKALIEEFSHAQLLFKQQVHIPIYHRNKKIGTYVPDFVIEDSVIIELKALPYIGTREKKQLWNYLKGSKYKLALLVNFGNDTLDIQRIVYDTARMSTSVPRDSAFVLRESASVPHLLSMTATPIPRTLALTIYGDLDLTLLDEMPPGRKQVITKIVPRGERSEMYAHVKNELASGRQTYVICPKIELGDGKLEVKNVKDEAGRLRKDIFPNHTIEILHSKIKPKEKEESMQRFLNQEIDILVSTSVVEVGVNVPNATVIIIEGAERFGLAQLHQLRGRVLRSTHQAYCYLLSEHAGIARNKRLQALLKAKNGFELAEEDLKIRGAGELSGRQQWGITDVGMEAIRNIKMVEAARGEAHALLKKDAGLAAYPLIQERLAGGGAEIHFE